jgi:hypothetical protein
MKDLTGNRKFLSDLSSWLDKHPQRPVMQQARALRYVAFSPRPVAPTAPRGVLAASKGSRLKLAWSEESGQLTAIPRG